MITFAEIMKKSKGEPVELRERMRGGLWIGCFCWTDDYEMMDKPALFDVETSWRDTGIGEYDNLHGELDGYLDKLCNRIGRRFGGQWLYDGGDCELVQI